MAKAKPNTPSTGRWRIVSMSAWDQEFINEEEEEEKGYFEFDQENNGQFHFGYVHGQMDCRLSASKKVTHCTSGQMMPRIWRGFCKVEW